VRWFLDPRCAKDVFDAWTFAKKKERLLRAEVARPFLRGIVQ
jgi:hypothetical protein